ncbi:Alpha-1,6-mannosyl-glycoprotein 2-beta-N-acetylglucosaminyltransferase [Trichinella patagoniensis]|uniref:Alpha-1,6-mannosyl-glycoprotein 2-beta-N-acetylglucosaminyltransferase n=1 Tax=Trichinella patagoniensis TaxID=990121 RepID=A0A0V0ZTL1_9BILA|nr:Alpha-1,6-mannosyl-glycoprotein 2-beta-N-acetylglucosaminyltransferase [Trichinella patagoniensis]
MNIERKAFYSSAPAFAQLLLISSSSSSSSSRSSSSSSSGVGGGDCLTFRRCYSVGNIVGTWFGVAGDDGILLSEACFRMLSSRLLIKLLKLTFTFFVLLVLVLKLKRGRGFNFEYSTTANAGILFRPSQPSALSKAGGFTTERESPVPPGSGGIEFIEAREPPPSPSVDEIRRIIRDNNVHADVLNENLFGPVENVSFVIVVQVHRRLNYLRKLVESFEAAPFINRALVIFSHDYYDVEMNGFVRSIRFCRVMQIFYPDNVQISPYKFPGQDPLDCARDIDKAQAQKEKCLNWDSPDRYGHYREASLTQIKHHWWWKINYVFDGIPRLKNYSDWVLLLEEDHYVSPDFLYTFDYIVRNRDNLCKHCQVITLGSYNQLNRRNSQPNALNVMLWFSSHHNMGMAINRSTWNAIRSCGSNFCKYDDYNWDWSLLHVSRQCMNPPLSTIVVATPRVFHIGDWSVCFGIHHKGRLCTADSSANTVVTRLKDLKPQLFPQNFFLKLSNRRSPKLPAEYGGWGDKRDHQLCMKNIIAQNV